jgi:protein TonB
VAVPAHRAGRFDLPKETVMTALAVGTALPPRFSRRAMPLDWSRISAWSGSMSLHVFVALMLLIPPVAMKVREVIKDVPIIVTIPETPPPAVREPDMPVPPIKIRKAPPPPPRPMTTITAPIPVPLPAPSEPQINSISPPSDAPAAAAPSGNGASDAPPSAVAYSMQTRIAYPRIALTNHIEGTVLLRVLVGIDGGVEQIEIERTSGSRDLDRAAREAVTKWKFKPGMRAGAAYSGWALVPVSFKLP